MHKSKLKKISLAVCLAFMPIYGFAAGMGKLNVSSGLGEPLKAEIELLSVTPEELSTLSATVASEEAYAVQGIPHLGIHKNIKVELIKNADGSPALRLRSLQPINDPYLDMLIQVEWSSGRLLREYTILLDPPEYKQSISEEPSSKPIVNKPSIASHVNTSTQADLSNAETSHQPVSKSKKAKKIKKTVAKAIDENESSVAPSEAGELTSQRGDTLNSIAKEVQIEGVSLDQMLVGLFEANKNAFVDGNINRLKVGQIIKVPSKEALIAIDSHQAAKEVKVHSTNWNAYRNSLAGNVLAAPVAEEVEQKQSASGKITSAEDKAAPVKTGPQDVIKLSAGGKVPAKAGKAGADFDAKVIALQEEATAREKALKDSQERMAALEAQIADMQKLLALKSQTMAGMQKNAVAAAKPVENKPPTPSTTPTAQPATPALVVSPTPTVPAVPVPSEATVEAQAAVPAATVPVAATPASEVAKKDDAAKNAKKKPPVAKAIVQPAPEPEPTLLESLLAGVDLVMLGGAAGIALLGFGWVYLRNKRRKDLDSFERGILTSGGLRANTVFGNTTGTVSTADTSFLTDFAQSADGSMIDTNDVDPIAEAEVYMAYGRDAQAEEILKDAITKEPKRYELHLKLLEMYAARKDISAFEAIAGELYTTLGADDPTWAKVAELGVTVEPDNPLYDISQIPAAATAAKLDADDSSLAGLDLGSSDDLDFSFEDKPKSNEPEADTVVDKDELKNESFDLNSEFSATVNEDASLVQKSDNANAVVSNTELATDNSMNFDFPDLGSLGSSDSESLGVDSSADNVASSPAEQNFAVEVPSTQSNSQSIEFTPAPTSAVAEVKAEGNGDDEFSLDFNFADTSAEEPAIQTVEAASDSADFSFEGFADAVAPDAAQVETQAESSVLDAVDFNFDGFDETSTSSNEDNMEVSSLEGIDLNFEAVDDQPAQSTDVKAEEISFDVPLTDDEELSVPNMEVSVQNQNEANNFDFSSISLDLNDNEPHVANEIQAIEVPLEDASQVTTDIHVPSGADDASVAVVNENPDIDIKLDLVKVYIDMEDVEGARDLLAEVLKEGGPQQRLTAEKLLTSLG